MCDIVISFPDANMDGKILFGKNSDRPKGECQPVSFTPSQEKGDVIHCAYLSVPAPSKRLATMGCRPYWCWGYETAMNEAGVVAGNTAVFTRAGKIENKDPGLTGMELLRLGLESGTTAEETVDTITLLLEKYGQYGSAVQGKGHEEGSYDNAYLIADKKEAWLLETAGKQWVAEKITQGTRSLSNELTIRNKFDRSSRDIKTVAENNNWHKPGKTDFDFAFSYSDHEGYARQVSHIRWKRTSQLLQIEAGGHTIQTIMKILRDHYEDTFLKGPFFSQFLPDFLTICMHDSPAKFTWGDTASSTVVEMDLESSGLPIMWVAYLPPCCSIYLPYSFSASLPVTSGNPGTAGNAIAPPMDAPTDAFSKNSLWWRIYRLVQYTSESPANRLKELRSYFDELEDTYIKKYKMFFIRLLNRQKRILKY